MSDSDTVKPAESMKSSTQKSYLIRDVDVGDSVLLMNFVNVGSTVSHNLISFGASSDLYL